MSGFPKTVSVTLYECEHDGDLAHYVDELAKAGAVVLETGLNEGDECCRIKMRVDSAEIAHRIQATDCWGYR